MDEAFDHGPLGYLARRVLAGDTTAGSQLAVEVLRSAQHARAQQQIRHARRQLRNVGFAVAGVVGTLATIVVVVRRARRDRAAATPRRLKVVA